MTSATGNFAARSARFELMAEATDFSLANAVALAQAAALAYEKDAAKVAEQAATWGLERGELFEDGARDASIALFGPGFVVAAFRGTDAWNDWRTNLNLAGALSDFGRVHRGFALATERLWGYVGGLLANEAKGRQIWFTGHSLGGAIAVLTAVKAATAGVPSIAGVYTYGAPMIASPAFTRRFDEVLRGRCYRFVNSIDTVPTLFAGLLRAPVGELRYIDRHGAIHGPRVPFRVRAADSLHQGRPSFFSGEPPRSRGLPMVVPHHMERYLEALAERFAEEQGATADA
jgi:triacylglycerol lipase